MLKEAKIFCPRKNVNLYVRIGIRHHLGQMNGNKLKKGIFYLVLSNMH